MAAGIQSICIKFAYKFDFNEQSVTFEDVVDVVLEVVDAHGIVQVALLVAVPVLGDDDGRIVVRVFQIIQQLAEAPWNDLEPRRGRSVQQQTSTVELDLRSMEELTRTRQDLGSPPHPCRRRS